MNTTGSLDDEECLSQEQLELECGATKYGASPEPLK